MSIGWKKSSRHLISDVNLDFSRKACWVKDGHRSPDPKESNYTGVISRDSVIIALNYDASLNRQIYGTTDVCVLLWLRQAEGYH